jgi:hypothetical protein
MLNPGEPGKTQSDFEGGEESPEEQTGEETPEVTNHDEEIPGQNTETLNKKRLKKKKEKDTC